MRGIFQKTLIYKGCNVKRKDIAKSDFFLNAISHHIRIYRSIEESDHALADTLAIMCSIVMVAKLRETPSRGCNSLLKHGVKTTLNI